MKKYKKYTRRTDKQRIIDMLGEVIELVKKDAPVLHSTREVLSRIPEPESEENQPVAPLPVALPAAAPAPQVKPVYKGPQKWNEFRKMRMQMLMNNIKSKKLTYDEALRIVAKNYREDRGLAPKTRKAIKVNAVDEAPESSLNRNSEPVKLSSSLPKPSQPVELSKPSQNSELAESGELSQNSLPKPSQPSQPKSQANSQSNSNSEPELPLNPSTYMYKDEGLNNTGMRKVNIAGKKYFMTDANRGLFARNSNNAIGDWQGYLEEGGNIRKTNEPDA